MSTITTTVRFDVSTAELDEDALIKARLYSTEERPFKRIQKRCTNLLESDTIVEVGDARDRLIEEIELDFASFEAAIMRVQLLTDANRKEVARYEEMREEILAASFKAKADMASLHTSLSLAQETKRNKLTYDAIASEIISTPHLKPRQTQQDSIARLQQEISDLEQEKDDYGKVWTARRQQFGEIVNALMGMQAQIQEDKEEQERREALDEDGSDDVEELASTEGKNNVGTEKESTGGTTSQLVSGINTPFAATSPMPTSQPTGATISDSIEGANNDEMITDEPVASTEIDEIMITDEIPIVTPGISNPATAEASVSHTPAQHELDKETVNPVEDSMDTT